MGSFIIRIPHHKFERDKIKEAEICGTHGKIMWLVA
jgi:hypothetical protein